MNLRNRLERLERTINTDPIVLYMPDGTQRVICPMGGYPDFILKPIDRAMSGDRTHLLEAIARNLGSTEPGGARMCEILREYLWVYGMFSEETRQEHRRYAEVQIQQQEVRLLSDSQKKLRNLNHLLPCYGLFRSLASNRNHDEISPLNRKPRAAH